MLGRDAATRGFRTVLIDDIVQDEAFRSACLLFTHQPISLSLIRVCADGMRAKSLSPVSFRQSAQRRPVVASGRGRAALPGAPWAWAEEAVPHAGPSCGPAFSSDGSPRP